MWTVPTGILFILTGVISAIPISKEGKTNQNNLDYQIDPQLLNYHLQQLLLESDQLQRKQSQQTQVKPLTTRYSVAQDQEYQVQLQQQLQAQYQDQVEQQFQSQLQSQIQQLQNQQYQPQLDSKTSQTTLQIPQSNSLTINPYQQPSTVQYQQPSSLQYEQSAVSSEQQQTPSPQVYQQPVAQQYQQPTVQYPQPSAQQYQQQSAQQQPLLGVAYSSAVDASKTSFSGYGIKYSF